MRHSSTFTDLAAAERATGGNLAANQGDISQWLSGSGRRLVINGPMNAADGGCTSVPRRAFSRLRG
ncbi:RNase A-like domain-containing protein [Streptomyces sp. NPDC020807]|uniref:RNase A-like domain-containing protein n=1 Tax=Streptomyces sp. NPDC020807 TaxID=3155119 RepID=UPI0033D7B571